MNRRDFLKSSTCAVAALAVPVGMACSVEFDEGEVSPEIQAWLDECTVRIHQAMRDQCNLPHIMDPLTGEHHRIELPILEGNWFSLSIQPESIK